MVGSTEPYTNGSDITVAGQNDAHARIYTEAVMNLIRQLIDRAGVWSAGLIAGWGDAYVDSNGRENSVDTSTSTAIYDDNNFKYQPSIGSGEASGDTTHDPDSFTNVNNAFDNDDATLADKSANNYTYHLGKTFSAKTVVFVRIKATAYNNSGSATKAIKLQSYNGSSWSDEATLVSTTATSATFDGYYLLNSSVQGLRLELSATSTGGPSSGHAYVYTLEYSTTMNDGLIYHSIPSGTFSNTISTAIGVPFVEDWETGANIQYKLTNTTEDSGWLDAMNTKPEVSSFTAFTAEPDTLIVKLVPKTTSPTSGYPSIKGFYINAWSD